MSHAKSSFTIVCQDEEQTVCLANRLAELLETGDVIALDGNLGAGKTRFVRAVAGAIGVDETTVSSPTYMIVQSYTGRLLLHHFDLYRIKEEEELYESGCEEFLEDGGVCLIEWASLFPDFLPVSRLEIEIRILSENSREFILKSFGKRYENLVKELGKQYSC